MLFNYLGHEQTPQGWLRASSLTPPPEVALANRVTHGREVVAWLEDGVLHVEWHSVTPSADSRFPARLLEHLQALVGHCLDPQAGGADAIGFPAGQRHEPGDPRHPAQTLGAEEVSPGIDLYLTSECAVRGARASSFFFWIEHCCHA
ncbi:hypothetical protein ACFS4T_12525 [Pseudomonas lini]